MEFVRIKTFLVVKMFIGVEMLLLEIRCCIRKMFGIKEERTNRREKAFLL